MSTELPETTQQESINTGFTKLEVRPPDSSKAARDEVAGFLSALERADVKRAASEIVEEASPLLLASMAEAALKASNDERVPDAVELKIEALIAIEDRRWPEAAPGTAQLSKARALVAFGEILATELATTANIDGRRVTQAEAGEILQTYHALIRLAMVEEMDRTRPSADTSQLREDVGRMLKAAGRAGAFLTGMSINSTRSALDDLREASTAAIIIASKYGQGAAARLVDDSLAVANEVISLKVRALKDPLVYAEFAPPYGKLIDASGVVEAKARPSEVFAAKTRVEGGNITALSRADFAYGVYATLFHNATATRRAGEAIDITRLPDAIDEALQDETTIGKVNLIVSAMLPNFQTHYDQYGLLDQPTLSDALRIATALCARRIVGKFSESADTPLTEKDPSVTNHRSTFNSAIAALDASLEMVLGNEDADNERAVLAASAAFAHAIKTLDRIDIDYHRMGLARSGVELASAAPPVPENIPMRVGDPIEYGEPAKAGSKGGTIRSGGARLIPQPGF